MNKNSYTIYPISVLELSHSTMQSAQDCMRKLEFQKFYGYNLKKPSLAGDGGNALHKALGVYLTTRDKHQAIWCLLQNYPILLNTYQKSSNKWSIEACYAALLSLFQYFDEHTELELAIINGKPAVEVAFSINVHHGIPDFLPVVYRGFIDFVFFNRLENTYTVIDLKNTTRELQDFTPVYKYSAQCLPYSLVLAAAMGKDFSNLEVQYLITKFSLINTKIIPLTFHKTTSDMEDWTQTLYTFLLNVKTFWETQWFPRKSGDCTTYATPCRFFEICATRHPITLTAMLQSLNQPPAKPFIPEITLDLSIST
jgi:hypothetical protein